MFSLVIYSLFSLVRRVIFFLFEEGSIGMSLEFLGSILSSDIGPG